MLPDGRRERRVSEEWAKDDALTALAERQHEIAAGKITKPEARTLEQLRNEYLAYKQGKKRTLAEGVRMLAPLTQMLLKRGNPFFLEETVRALVETRALAGERGALGSGYGGLLCGRHSLRRGSMALARPT
jgi:hypothetical protein